MSFRRSLPTSVVALALLALPITAQERGTITGQVTDAAYHAGDLYLTSIAGDWIARCPLGGG